MSTTKYPILANLISSGEGGVNSVNRGNAGDTPGGAKSIFGKNLTELTVGEILKAQMRDTVFAVGKYQFIPGTLKRAVDYTNIPLNAKFDLQTQDRLFDYLIDVKRPIVGQYINAKSNNKSEAIQSLAREFASVGLEYPENGKIRGQSRYAGSGNNKAIVTPDAIGQALDAQRKAGPGSTAGYTPSIVNPYGGLSSGTQPTCNCGVLTPHRYEFTVVYNKTEQARNQNTNQIRRDWLYLQVVGNIPDDAAKDRILIYLK